MPSRIATFAKALFVLHEADLLRNEDCKGAVKTFIRQASEDSKWNLSTDYRSRDAERVINAATICSEAKYHAFCKKRENKLRHEHMVPGEVVYHLLINHPRPSVLAFARILKRTGYRATITELEDKKLLKKSMPPEFFDPGSSMYFNHRARYIVAKIDGELKARPPNGWWRSDA